MLGSVALSCTSDVTNANHMTTNANHMTKNAIHMTANANNMNTVIYGMIANEAYVGPLTK